MDEVAVELAGLVDAQDRLADRLPVAQEGDRGVEPAAAARRDRTPRPGARGARPRRTRSRGASSSAWSPRRREKTVSDPNAAPIAAPRTMTTSARWLTRPANRDHPRRTPWTAHRPRRSSRANAVAGRPQRSLDLVGRGRRDEQPQACRLRPARRVGRRHSRHTVGDRTATAATPLSATAPSSIA